MFKTAFITSTLIIVLASFYVSKTDNKINVVNIPKNTPVQNITFDPVFITAGSDGTMVEYSPIDAGQ